MYLNLLSKATYANPYINRRHESSGCYVYIRSCLISPPFSAIGKIGVVRGYSLMALVDIVVLPGSGSLYSIDYCDEVNLV